MSFWGVLVAAGMVFTGPTKAQNQDQFQHDIDAAFIEIMSTQMGQAICHEILGAQADAIEFHLGVSSSAAEIIAQNCPQPSVNPWIAPTSINDLRRLTFKSFGPRKYELITAETDFQIESWTDPFTNTTALLVGSQGLSHQRLVQLLAHELAVYFDSKVNPAHPAAQDIPQLRDLNVERHSDLNPLLAISDPLIAHNLTFVRALQVESSIVTELVESKKIEPPSDFADPYLRHVISGQCQQKCLAELIANMKSTFLPLSLPLVAFAPFYRSSIVRELELHPPSWSLAQWSRMQESLTVLPVEFLSNQFTGNPIADLQQVFIADKTNLHTVSDFITEDLWPVEWPAVEAARANGTESLMEFMKRPLLSGYNIFLSSGPRVRVRPGNTQ